MTRVRYIADTLAEAISAARRAHGMEVPVLQAGQAVCSVKAWAVPAGHGTGAVEPIADV